MQSPSEQPPAHQTAAHQNAVFENGGNRQISGAYSLRFSIRGIAIFTALSAGLFALIGLLGGLAGTLIGFAIVTIFFASALLIGVIRHAQMSNAERTTHNGWLICLAALTLLLFLVSGFAGGGTVAAHYFSRQAERQELSSELGFSYEIEPNQVGIDYSARTTRIVAIDPGSEFERAGFLVDDIIVDQTSDDFFELLKASSGESVTVTVATSASAGTQLDKLPRRAVTFNVP